MKEILPVYIEDRELPVDPYKVNDKRVNSYGYINVLYFFSIISVSPNIAGYNLIAAEKASAI